MDTIWSGRLWVVEKMGSPYEPRISLKELNCMNLHTNQQLHVSTLIGKVKHK